MSNLMKKNIVRAKKQCGSAWASHSCTLKAFLYFSLLNEVTALLAGYKICAG